MEATKEERIAKAVECMKTLDIYNEYIKAFKNNGTITRFCGFGGYYIEKDSDEYKKIQELEEKYNITIYGVVYNQLDDMSITSYLCVSQYKEEWPYLAQPVDNGFYTLAYADNLTESLFSEFGDIVIQSAFGGIKRIA